MFKIYVKDDEVTYERHYFASLEVGKLLDKWREIRKNQYYQGKKIALLLIQNNRELFRHRFDRDSGYVDHIEKIDRQDLLDAISRQDAS